IVVFSGCKHLKVVDAVIRFVPTDVVNGHAFGDRSQKRSRYKAMNGIVSFLPCLPEMNVFVTISPDAWRQDTRLFASRRSCASSNSSKIRCFVITFPVWYCSPHFLFLGHSPPCYSIVTNLL